MAFGQQNYAPYGGQQMGMQQPMQQPMQQMGMQQPLQGWYPQQMQQPAGMLCRLVSCVEEVRASPADLSGEPALFYNPHARVFYIKEIDRMTGKTDVQAYGRIQPEPEQPDPLTAQLLARVEKLEEMAAAQPAPAPRSRKAAVTDAE